jgi:hypothetical protein
VSAGDGKSWAALSWRRLLVLLALGVAFVAGIGFGEALHDRPDLGGTQTLIRTLHPLPIATLPPETVTVTTSGP